jgi:MarR family transcriptional regulator for hemolysin
MDKLQDLRFRPCEVARLYARRIEERTQTLSLQFAGCKALILIAENEGITQTHLSKISEIDPARLVGIVDRLEADGWAQRRRRPDDRRVRSLTVTESAQPVLRSIRRAISETYVQALRGLSADEIRTLAKVLECVHSNLSNRAPRACMALSYRSA